MNKLVIGLVGEKGAGKETFSKILTGLLPRKSISVISSGKFLKETLDLWGIETTRKHLQRLAIVMDAEYGDGTVTQAIRTRILNDPSEIIIFDGIRWQTDVDLIRSFPNNLLIYITADPKTRFKRLVERNEKSGESKTTWEQFLKEEKEKTETDIPKLGSKADFKAENNGTLEGLKEKVTEFVKDYSLHI
jgi:dephospho-CoA kinase